MSADAAERGQPETAAEHFRECGPFCPHVTFCDDCANVFGLCERHKADPGKAITWKRGGRAAARKQARGDAAGVSVTDWVRARLGAKP